MVLLIELVGKCTLIKFRKPHGKEKGTQCSASGAPVALAEVPWGQSTRETEHLPSVPQRKPRVRGQPARWLEEGVCSEGKNCLVPVGVSPEQRVVSSGRSDDGRGRFHNTETRAHAAPCGGKREPFLQPPCAAFTCYLQPGEQQK